MTTEHEQRKEEAVKPLREWLHANHARCNWSVPIPQVGTVSGYVVNGRLFVILDFGDDGWEAFTPVPGLDVKKTLEALEVASGLKEET